MACCACNVQVYCLYARTGGGAPGVVVRAKSGWARRVVARQEGCLQAAMVGVHTELTAVPACVVNNARCADGCWGSFLVVVGYKLQTCGIHTPMLHTAPGPLLSNSMHFWKHPHLRPTSSAPQGPTRNMSSDPLALWRKEQKEHGLAINTHASMSVAMLGVQHTHACTYKAHPLSQHYHNIKLSMQPIDPDIVNKCPRCCWIGTITAGEGATLCQFYSIAQHPHAQAFCRDIMVSPHNTTNNTAQEPRGRRPCLLQFATLNTSDNNASRTKNKTQHSIYALPLVICQQLVQHTQHATPHQHCY